MSKLTKEERLKRVQDMIGAWPDFPQKGIMFRDVFPMMKDPEIFNDCISLMTEHIRENHGQVDVIVGLDARGFIFAPMIAQQLGVSFVPVRKAGKLPGPTLKQEYALEYGKDVFEIQRDAVKPGQKVVIVDDLLATGGTMSAALSLLTSVQAEVVECMVVIELTDLKGRVKVKGPLKSFICYEGLIATSAEPGMATTVTATNRPNVQQPNMHMNQQPQPHQLQQPQPGGQAMNATANNSLLDMLSTDIENLHITLDGQRQEQMQQQQHHEIIWTGVLEWHEKSTHPDRVLQIPRSLSCQVSVGTGDAEVNAVNWPSKLSMQLIPQNLLQPLHTLFRSARTVTFTFNNQEVETLKALYKVMASGFAGYIHFAPPAQSEVKVLMLLYSSRRKKFMGLIPNEQARFVNSIRRVISNHKFQQIKSAGQGMNAATNNSLPDMLPTDIGNLAITLVGQQQQQMQQQQQHEIIWTGVLEWYEKSNHPDPAMQIPWSLSCQVSVDTGDAEVNAVNWPSKLSMQLIPQNLLQPLHALFRSARTVTFTFNNQEVETLQLLFTVMASGFAGYVHFAPPDQCEVKAFMLLFSSRRKRFMGLIPNDQARFINSIRRVISNVKSQQIKRDTMAVGMVQPGMQPGQPGGPSPILDQQTMAPGTMAMQDSPSAFGVPHQPQGTATGPGVQGSAGPPQ